METAQNTPIPKAQQAKVKKPLIITIVVSIIIIILAAAGVYYWQQGVVKGLNEEKGLLEAKVASQSANLVSLEKGNTNLEAKIDFLEKKLKEATASSQKEPGELTLSTGGVKHYSNWQYGLGEKNDDFLLVDLTVKNSSDQELFFSIFDLKLKDDKNKVYPYYTVLSQPNLSGGLELPKGKVELRDQQVSVGETVTGTVIFLVPKDKNLFSLFYNSSSITIAAK